MPKPPLYDWRTVDYIAECLTEQQAESFYRMIRKGQRIGQAFFNALPTDQAEMLRGTIHDPFYSDEPDKVLSALEYITR